jgi:hypothetical protein
MIVTSTNITPPERPPQPARDGAGRAADADDHQQAGLERRRVGRRLQQATIEQAREQVGMRLDPRKGLADRRHALVEQARRVVPSSTTRPRRLSAGKRPASTSAAE